MVHPCLRVRRLRQRAAEFDRLAAATRDPVIRKQFVALTERFLTLAEDRPVPRARPPSECLAEENCGG